MLGSWRQAALIVGLSACTWTRVRSTSVQIEPLRSDHPAVRAVVQNKSANLSGPEASELEQSAVTTLVVELTDDGPWPTGRAGPAVTSIEPGRIVLEGADEVGVVGASLVRTGARTWEIPLPEGCRWSQLGSTWVRRGPWIELSPSAARVGVLGVCPAGHTAFSVELTTGETPREAVIGADRGLAQWALADDGSALGIDAFSAIVGRPGEPALVTALQSSETSTYDAHVGLVPMVDGWLWHTRRRAGGERLIVLDLDGTPTASLETSPVQLVAGPAGPWAVWVATDADPRHPDWPGCRKRVCGTRLDRQLQITAEACSSSLGALALDWPAEELDVTPSGAAIEGCAELP